MGAVSPYGIGVPSLIENLYEGNSAVVNMKEQWQAMVGDLNCWVGAPVQGVIDEKSIPRKYRKTMGKSAILSVLAAREALAQAGIPDELLPSGRIGVSFSSSTGSVESTEKFFAEPFLNHVQRNLPSGIFFQIMSHTSAANVAQTFNIRGRVISPNAACSSSAQAIGLAFESIQSGKQDIMICGGSDELHVMTCVSFDIVQAASFKFNESPEKTPRPFDKLRDGTVCAEGAGCLILESEESAIARGVPILGEIIGFATGSSGENIAQSDAESIVHCMSEALSSAGVSPQEIDYINAHATGTLVGDITEAQAIRAVFGENSVPVSSFKGHIGHTLGASGVLELAAVFEMISRNRIAGTKNLDEPDELCQGVRHLRQAESIKINTFIKNSFAFGGINTVIVGKRYSL
jgi:3-oxoacyl-[acyl-carrier-protein] synthase II